MITDGSHPSYMDPRSNAQLSSTLNDYATALGRPPSNELTHCHRQFSQEISRNVNEAATGSSGIAENISSVATASQATTDGAGETQKAAGEPAQMSAELKQLVDAYRY